MTRRVGTAGRASVKPVIVIAGEDGNDRKALRILLEHACPDMRGRLVEIKDNVPLRSASGKNLRDRVSVLHRKALARAERERAELACLFVHEDWDDVDGAPAEAAQQRVQEALDAAAGRAHYVLAVWEIEAWLLLFPAALKAIVSAWSVPAGYRGRDTGLFTDPKRILRTDCSSGSRRYQESDVPDVLQHAVDGGHIDRTRDRTARGRGSGGMPGCVVQRMWSAVGRDGRQCGRGVRGGQRGGGARRGVDRLVLRARRGRLEGRLRVQLGAGGVGAGHVLQRAGRHRLPRPRRRRAGGRPHMLLASSARPSRLLVADAVGLGKTLEIGTILAELARRGRAQRLLGAASHRCHRRVGDQHVDPQGHRIVEDHRFVRAGVREIR